MILSATRRFLMIPILALSMPFGCPPGARDNFEVSPADTQRNDE